MQQFYELDIFMQKPEMSPETKRVMLLLTTLPRSECGGLASAMPHLHLQLMQLLGPLILGMKGEMPRLRVNLALVYV